MRSVEGVTPVREASSPMERKVVMGSFRAARRARSGGSPGTAAGLAGRSEVERAQHAVDAVRDLAVALVEVEQLGDRARVAVVLVLVDEDDLALRELDAD